MGYPYTDTGHNMFDMLSMIQKAIRRADYEHAGFAANQLKNTYRPTTWNRLLVISAEDCFGVLTKELVELRRQDEAARDNQILAKAVALMCRAKKSRDACYFACNFILASRSPRALAPAPGDCEQLYRRIKGSNGASYDDYGFAQTSLFSGAKQSEAPAIPEPDMKKALAGANLQIAMHHRDMDMIGHEVGILRAIDREYLWSVILDYSQTTAPPLVDEIIALKAADGIVNLRRKDLEKDEIFISKSIMLISYFEHEKFDVLSSDIVAFDRLIDWSSKKVKPIEQCQLRGAGIPEWVYDCHTIRGKKMGKTDWDMTVSEQAALTPLQRAYFDDASWIYIYEQDVETGVLTEKGMKPIREFAKTHPANPVQFIPYE